MSIIKAKAKIGVKGMAQATNGSFKPFLLDLNIFHFIEQKRTNLQV